MFHAIEVLTDETTIDRLARGLRDVAKPVDANGDGSWWLPEAFVGEAEMLEDVRERIALNWE